MCILLHVRTEEAEIVGQPVNDGSIQWQYAPVDRIHVLIPEMEY